MELNSRKTIIKLLCGFFGSIMLALGFFNLIAVFLALKNHNIFDVTLFIKILVIVKVLFFIYLGTIGYAVYREKSWVSHGVIFLPFIFPLIDYLSRTERTLGSYFLWLVFLCFLVLFFNLKEVKIYLEKNKEVK